MGVLDGFAHLVVTEVRQEAEGVRSLRLARRDGRPLPEWTPGAHVDVLVGEGEVRQYSLCSSPADDEWRIAVLREPDGRGGSRWLHDRVRPGDVLAVGRPRNDFPLDLGPHRAPPRDRLVILAGGIGITPLLPMAAAAEAAGADWSLLYLGAGAARMAFTGDLRRYGDRVVVHRDDESGVIDLEPALDRLGAGTAAVYACGPAGLLAAVEGYAAGRPGCRLVLERFTAGPGAVVPSRTGDHPFVVVTADGTEVPVGADETILDAVRSAGVPALSSCAEGICGTCETRVLAGVPDHRDQLLSEEEQASGETMMICVSRCRGDRLVLDL
jgi:ferredoxin-NADP reductase